MNNKQLDHIHHLHQCWRPRNRNRLGVRVAVCAVLTGVLLGVFVASCVVIAL